MMTLEERVTAISFGVADAADRLDEHEDTVYAAAVRRHAAALRALATELAALRRVAEAANKYVDSDDSTLAWMDLADALAALDALTPEAPDAR